MEQELKIGDKLYTKNNFGYYHTYVIARTTKAFLFATMDGGTNYEYKINKKDIGGQYRILTPDVTKAIDLWHMQNRFRTHLENLVKNYEGVPLKVMLDIMDLSKEFLGKKDAG